MDYDMFDHMPVICEIKCEKYKNEYCDLRSFQDFSKFEVGAFLNDLSMKLRNMSLCAVNCEDVNKCKDEFESIFNGTVFDHAPVKISSKEEEKQKAKPWITKDIVISINFKNLMFKFAIKGKTKKNMFLLKSIEI